MFFKVQLFIDYVVFAIVGFFMFMMVLLRHLEEKEYFMMSSIVECSLALLCI